MPSFLLTGVYVIRHVASDKRYVGSTGVSLRKRIGSHKYELNKNNHCNKYLQRSWNKYGASAFVFEVVERCSAKSCVSREQYWIGRFCTTDPSRGYNVAPVAGSVLGLKRGPDSLVRSAGYKAERSVISSRAWANDPQRRVIQSKAMKLKYSSPEARAKLSKQSIDGQSSPEQRAAISSRSVEMWKSPEFRVKHAEAMRRSCTPEVLAKRSASLKGRVQTPESNEKRSKAMKARHQRKVEQVISLRRTEKTLFDDV